LSMAATSTTTTSIEDGDALQSLEERILRAVDLVAQLRQEKEAAVKASEDLKAENTRLSEELEVLQSERKQVRERIEKLLGQMDNLAS
jgi:FtsZ-binding cell division protein ZapB